MKVYLEEMRVDKGLGFVLDLVVTYDGQEEAGDSALEMRVYLDEKGALEWQQAHFTISDPAYFATLSRLEMHSLDFNLRSAIRQAMLAH